MLDRQRQVDANLVGKCPYKALEYFTQEDAVFLYGRTVLTDELIDKVRTDNFIAVLGRREMIEVATKAGETCQKLAWNPAQKAHFLANQGRAIGQGGDFKGAMAKFQDARKLSSNIQVPTEKEVEWWAAGGLVKKGEKLVKEGNVKEALAAYQKAQALKPTWKLYPESWNTLCRYGSRHKQAIEVMKACENAVTLAPKNGEFRDSRGIARALTGDTAGAIEDFQLYIQQIAGK